MTMTIYNHRLYVDGKPVRFVESPNHGGRLHARYLLMHYTAGVNITSTVSWFLNRDAKASSHVVIDRDGAIIQTVSFNMIAWHAGPSTWKDRETQEQVIGLNTCSIGIEMVNVGRLQRDASTKRWTSLRPRREFDDADVAVAVHKHETVPCGWQRYTPAQVAVAKELAALLCRAYKLRDVMGHEDVAPRRKFDPGPAFPLDELREQALRAART